MQPTTVTIDVDGERFETQISSRREPPSIAPAGDGSSLPNWGMFSLTVPAEFEHLIGSNADRGNTITMSDATSSTTVIMLMGIYKSASPNAYVCIEPEAFHSWNGLENYPQS